MEPYAHYSPRPGGKIQHFREFREMEANKGERAPEAVDGESGQANGKLLRPGGNGLHLINRKAQ
jgi:hypothetical protein